MNDGRKTCIKLRQKLLLATEDLGGGVPGWNNSLAPYADREIFPSPEGTFTLEESWMHTGGHRGRAEVLPLFVGDLLEPIYGRGTALCGEKKEKFEDRN